MRIGQFITKARRSLALWILAALASSVGGANAQPLAQATPELVRAEKRFYGDRLVMGGNLVIAENEVVDDVVIIGGELELLGEIRGDLTVVGGKAVLNGRIGRELRVVLGAVDFGDQSEVGGEAILLGGPFKLSASADVPRLAFMFESDYPAKIAASTLGWLRGGLLLGRLYSSLETSLLAAMIFLLVYGYLVWMAPSPVGDMGRLLRTRPMAALLSGMTAFVVLGPLCLLLVLSVVTIPAIPLVLAVVAGLTLFGKAALCVHLGGLVFRGDGPPSLSRFVVPLGVGLLLLSIAYLVPVMGVVVWGMTTCWGLGVVILWTAASMFPAQADFPGQPVAAEAGSEVGMAPAPMAAAAPAHGRVAGFLRRTAAALVDWIILACSIPLIGPFVFLLAMAYFITMWVWKGTTLGGAALRLRVERSTGSPMDYPSAFIRSFSSIFSGLPLFLGFIWVAWDSRKESWHDKVAGTRVVVAPRGQPVL